MYRIRLENGDVTYAKDYVRYRKTLDGAVVELRDGSLAECLGYEKRAAGITSQNPLHYEDGFGLPAKAKQGCFTLSYPYDYNLWVARRGDKTIMFQGMKKEAEIFFANVRKLIKIT